MKNARHVKVLVLAKPKAPHVLKLPVVLSAGGEGTGLTNTFLIEFFNKVTNLKVISGIDTAYFDVDDTLVMWDTTLINENSNSAVLFDNPDDPKIKWLLLPNPKTIEALKAQKRAGGTVIVWSAGGWDWALEVVTKLGLIDYVDAVMSKPNRYYDDLPSSEFMGTRYDFSNHFSKK